MIKRILDMSPRANGKRLRGAFYSAAITPKGYLAICRAEAGEIILIDIEKERISRVSFEAHAPVASDDGTIPASACFAALRGNEFLVHPAGSRLIIKIDSSGNILSKTNCPFEPIGLSELDSNGIVAAGFYAGNFLHVLNSNCQIQKSLCPLEDDAAVNLRPFATDRVIVVNADNKRVDLLLETRSGIIDRINLKSGKQERRFRALTKETLPIAQNTAAISAALSNTGSSEKVLWLTYPPFSQPAVLSITGVGLEIFAVMGCGRHVLQLGPNMEVIACFSLDKLLESVPELLRSAQRPYIFSVLKVKEKWVACCSNGTILSFDRDDLKDITLSHCLLQFRSNKYEMMAMDSAGHIIDLSDEAIEQSRKRRGAIPELSNAEIEKHKTFWTALGGFSAAYDLMLSEDGNVVQGAFASNLPDASIEPKNAATMKMVLERLKSMVFSTTSASKLRVIVSIDQSIDEIVSARKEL